MTAKELIKILSTFPPEKRVIFSSYSEGIHMTVSGVELENCMYNDESVIAIQE